MSKTSTLYPVSTLEDLRLRTEYEVWMLEAVYNIVDQRPTGDSNDTLVYPPNGGPPKQTNFMSINAVLFDWRSSFLAVGAPLVFVTAFKLLDMLMEWVLLQNGGKPTFRFTDKIKKIKGPLYFPDIIETRSWLRERLIALYEQLEPFRGTIVHARHFHFKSTENSLRISSSKGNKIGPPKLFTQADLRNLALTLVSIVRYIEGVKVMSALAEKSIRRMLDEIVHLHQLSEMGQLPPACITARVYVLEKDLIEIDIAKITDDVKERFKEMDMIWNLRVIAINHNSKDTKAYLIPWDLLHTSGHTLSKPSDELTQYEVAVPDDVDAIAVTNELTRSSRR